ncbi:MAG: hypothetical protein L0Y72_04835 [Gemmataceae bacterium]|nr:hypothetical protein [Gemmataceae bacterium]MCI0738347.1 hypothetical protein [Gemmataceae bacterium]
MNSKLATVQIMIRAAIVCATFLVLPATLAAQATAAPVQDKATKETPARSPAFRLGTARFSNLGKVFAVAFSPDGKQLACGSWDGHVSTWDLSSHKLVREWAAHKQPIRALAYSPDGASLATASVDRQVRLWDAKTGADIKALDWKCNHYLTFLQFHPNGQWLCGGGWGGVVVWDLASRKVLHQADGQLGEHRPSFVADAELLRWSQEQYDFDSRSMELSYHELDVKTGRRVHKAWGENQPIGTFLVAFAPSGKFIRVRLNELFAGAPPSLQERRLLQADKLDEVPEVAFSPGERLLALHRGDRHIWIIETATGQIRTRLQQGEVGTNSLTFSPDGKLLACGDRDRTTLVWRVAELPKPQELSKGELQALWKDLNALDGAKAHRAIEMLAANPDNSLPLLSERLRPAPPIDAKQVLRLIEDLASEQFVVRNQAHAELEKLNDAAVPYLKKSLETTQPLEIRRRMEALLQKTASWWDEQWPTLRALETLEWIDAPQARAIFERLAAGDPARRLTQEARAALKRMRNESVRATDAE